MQLDCSDSVNFLYNRESCVQVLEVPPKSSVVSSDVQYYHYRNIIVNIVIMI